MHSCDGLLEILFQPPSSQRPHQDGLGSVKVSVLAVTALLAQEQLLANPDRGAASLRYLVRHNSLNEPTAFQNMKNLAIHASTMAALTLAAATTSIPMPVRAEVGATSADVAAITKIVKAWVQADLAGNPSFYENQLSDDWTGGTSRGTFSTKASMLADMKDTKNNKTNSGSIANIKVRTYGDMAIATYSETYDAMIKGQHYARTVICTDSLHRMGITWKIIASHCSQTAK